MILLLLKWYLIIGIVIGVIEAILLIMKETPFKEVATNTLATILVWPWELYHAYQKFKKRNVKKNDE